MYVSTPRKKRPDSSESAKWGTVEGAAVGPAPNITGEVPWKGEDNLREEGEETQTPIHTAPGCWGRGGGEEGGGACLQQEIKQKEFAALSGCSPSYCTTSEGPGINQGLPQAK